MYHDILEDLKQEYPGRKILTLEEVAGMVSKTRMALYKLKERGGLTIPFKKEGGKYQISIYAFAKWLAEGGDEKPVQAGKVSVEPVKKKPRSGVSIGKILFGFMENIQQMQEQVDFNMALYRELEQIELMKQGDKLQKQPRIGL